MKANTGSPSGPSGSFVHEYFSLSDQNGKLNARGMKNYRFSTNISLYFGNDTIYKCKKLPFYNNV